MTPGGQEPPRHSLYDLRHTFATLLLAGSADSPPAPITYVAAQMGHATPATTLRFYARWIPRSGTVVLMTARTTSRVGSLDHSSSICHRSVTDGRPRGSWRTRSRLAVAVGRWDRLQLLAQKNKSGGVAAPRSSGEP